MKKVLVLACAAFFSGQAMAQTTSKTSEAAQAKANAVAKQQAEATPTKAEIVASIPVAAPATETAPVAPVAITETKVVQQKAAATAELSKTAPTPALAKPEPIKE